MMSPPWSCCWFGRQPSSMSSAQPFPDRLNRTIETPQPKERQATIRESNLLGGASLVVGRWLGLGVPKGRTGFQEVWLKIPHTGQSILAGSDMGPLARSRHQSCLSWLHCMSVGRVCADLHPVSLSGSSVSPYASAISSATSLVARRIDWLVAVLRNSTGISIL